MFHSSLDSQVIQGLSDIQISDTVSESSDNATLLSLSREDLSQVGAGPIREDVRVSRKKLEGLILKEREDEQGSKGLVESLMESTNTFIQWPSRMKIGAKTKKDLFVRVYGHDEADVAEAKQHILQELGPQRDLKITLKLEISYTDHSHLIGCRGATIREVMDDTACHIHFPDSNRMSKEHKSNQVTIAGAMIENVEQARSRVRELSPLIFQFNLPAIQNRFDVMNPDANTVYIDNIQSTYNVMVTVHPPNKLQQTSIAVKGCEVDHAQVKEAVGRIITYFSPDTPITSVLMESTMEITPAQHAFVRSVNDSNIHSIMMSTGAKIVFPDLSDTNIQQIKRSRIYITGDLNCVYLARQQLIGCLPLRMIFDLSDQFPLDWESMRQICAELNVNAKMINRNRASGQIGPNSSLPPPVPGRSRTIQLITAERNAGSMIESRRRILGGFENQIMAKIPVTYLLRHLPPPGLVSFTGNLGHPGATLAPMMLNSPNMLSPILSPSFWPPTPFCSPQLILPGHDTHMMGSTAMTPVPGAPYRRPYHGLMPHKYGRDYGFDTRSPGDRSFQNSPLAPMNLMPRFDFQQNRRAPGFERSNTNPSVVLSPPEMGSEAGPPKQNTANEKRYLAMKAMYQSRLTNQPRTPTSAWAGYGFSKTYTNLFPTQEDTAGQNTVTELDDVASATEESGTTTPWTTASSDTEFDANNNVIKESKGEFGPSFRAKPPLLPQTSNLMEYAINPTVLDVSSAFDLPSLFIQHGLDKYIDQFMSEELDLTSFSTLSEADLRTLGVSSYPARKKMLLLISQLQTSQ